SEPAAQFLSKARCPPNTLATTAYEWERGQIIRSKDEPTPAEVAAQLTRLRQREFWMRQRGDNPPSKQRAFTVPDPKVTDALRKRREKLIDTVMSRCGRLKTEVLAEMQARPSTYVPSASTP